MLRLRTAYISYFYWVVLGTQLLKATPSDLSISPPLIFEPAQSHAVRSERWLARGKNYHLQLANDAANISFLQGHVEMPGMLGKISRSAAAAPVVTRVHSSTMRMRLSGSHPWTNAVGLEPTGGYSQYYIGNDATRWQTDVPHYSRLKIEKVYDGIDMVLYGDRGDLEFDFLVAPSSDPAQIRLAFEGVSRLRIDPGSGDLLGETDGGDVLRTIRPKVYQEAGDHRVEVAGHYQMTGPGEIGFRLETYDATKSLVIDPTIQFTVFFEGNGIDTPTAIAADNAGNSYVTGYTFSTDFPVLNGLSGIVGKICGTTCPPYAFVTKLSPSGGILFSTYLGGNQLDLAHGIAVDINKSRFDGVYITGTTLSGSTFPQTTTQFAEGSSEAFVTKLNVNGQLLYSTLFGGVGIDDGYAIAIDGSHAAYVAGLTESVNFPTSLYYSAPLIPMQKALRGPEDGFVTKIDPSGYLNQGYSTYLGGSEIDRALGICVDANGNAYVTGVTASSDFPTIGPTTSLSEPGAATTFVTKLSPDGSGAVYSVYLSGSANEGLGIAINGAREAYVAGDTASYIETTPNAAQSLKPSPDTIFSGFIRQIDSHGFFKFGTYLGGINDASCTSVALSANGSVYVGGVTSSTVNFPMAASVAPNPTAGFLTKLSPDLNAAEYTMLLGAQVNGIAVQKGGIGRWPPIYLTDTVIFTTGYRWKAGSGDPNKTPFDGFVVKVSEPPLILSIP